ncbi:MAG: FAD-dependent oxidoreductase, partial [Anaerolineales bacterium]|nr:FAD-dependent oxidoreductase [Anaerolineales bacterium]
MSSHTSEAVVICGAGIAGLSVAYQLAVVHGRPVTVVDERPPLSLTSDKSTEAYRNWWPGPGDAMVRLMNRSIDLLEQWARATDNGFHLNRRGYLYLTADPARVPAYLEAARATAALGAGEVRLHSGAAGEPAYQPHAADGFAGGPEGADLLLDQALIRRHFPYVSETVVAALHARRAGWLSAQGLGIWFLEQVRAHGGRLSAARVTGVDVDDRGVSGVRLSTGERLATRTFVDAAGPLVAEVAQLVGVDLPVYHERHIKLNFADAQGVVPREAPMLIWDDPQTVAWGEDERAALAEDPATRWLLEPLPGGVHMRPDGPAGSPIRLMLWDYHQAPVEPVVPAPVDDEFFPELVLRGLTTMVPGLRAYHGRAGKPVVDGGYYTKTRENRLLAGPLPVAGAF